jgi:hypothetical protein
MYRIPYFSPGQFPQYREAVLWAKATRGPDPVALSHETALAVYGISDANPASIHLTVPSTARLRRKIPKGIIVHHGDLSANDIAVQEGIPVTTIERTLADLLHSGGRSDLLKQAVSDARREGFHGGRCRPASAPDRKPSQVVALFDKNPGAGDCMTRQRPRERLEKTLARIAREQGSDQERYCSRSYRAHVTTAQD